MKRWQSRWKTEKSAGLLFYKENIVKKRINGQGELDVKGRKYILLDFVYVDNELKAESAIQAAYRFIEQDKVLAVVGPQGSGRAIPAARINNDTRTPGIRPVSQPGYDEKPALSNPQAPGIPHLRLPGHCLHLGSLPLS
jgi:ABC-type branched-subunit amino acid transport system substrate-binding protein